MKIRIIRKLRIGILCVNSVINKYNCVIYALTKRLPLPHSISTFDLQFKEDYLHSIINIHSNSKENYETKT